MNQTNDLTKQLIDDEADEKDEIDEIDTEADEADEKDEIDEIDAEADEADEADEPAEETEPKMVPLAALHESRQETREIRQQLDQLNQIVAQINQRTETPAAATSAAAANEDPEPMAGMEADDIPTAGQIREQRAWEQRQAYRQRQAWEQQQRQVATTKAVKVDDLLSAEMTVESHGPGLDYDSVVKTGQQWLTHEDVEEIQRMGVSLASGRLLYQRCVERCPHLAVIAKVQTKKTGGDSPPKATNKTKTETTAPPPKAEPAPPASIDAVQSLEDDIFNHLYGKAEEVG